MNTAFENYKTTIPGAILVISALGMFISKAIMGTLEGHDFEILLGVLAGAGLIAAKDGNK